MAQARPAGPHAFLNANRWEPNPNPLRTRQHAAANNIKARLGALTHQENGMKRLYSAMIAAALVYGCASSPPLQEENCGLQVPPKESYPEFRSKDSAFKFVFTYPKDAPNNYTGCQTKWKEDGRMHSVIHFKRGKVVQYESYDEDGNLFVSCHPKSLEYMKAMTPYSMCPSYESVMESVQTLQGALPYEGEVPSERDPRGKGILPIPDYVIQDESLLEYLIKGKNCDLQATPKDMLPSVIYRVTFINIYPMLLPDNYTGCQIIFNSDHSRGYLFHFNQGLMDVTVRYGSDRRVRKACRMQGQKIYNGFYCPDRRLYDGYLKTLQK